MLRTEPQVGRLHVFGLALTVATIALPSGTVTAAARAHWMNVRAIRTRIVKSYAPGIVHCAAEVQVAPQNRP